MFGKRLIDNAKIVVGLAPVVPSSATPDYVKLDNADHLTVVISVKNATSVTGSAITLKQATSAAAAGEKALAFTKMWADTDVGAGDTLTETTVTSNTFTTDSTNSKDLLYIIEVDASSLDVDNGFNWIRAGTGNATAATVSVLYILTGQRYSGNVALIPTAIA